MSEWRFCYLKNGKVIDIECDQLNINAPAGVNITAPNVQCSAQMTAASQITGNGVLAVQGGNGASFSGDINQSAGSYHISSDVITGGISLSNHDHSSGVVNHAEHKQL